MIKRNNGSTEQEILQNRFTALVTVSVNRARIDYLRKETSRTRNTYEMEDEKFTNVEDMIKSFEKLDIDYDKTNYFVKKAQIILNEKGW